MPLKLPSLVQMNPRPTRAEATDIANCVLDGTDGFIVGAQTAHGLHVREAVEAIMGISRQAETAFDCVTHSERVAMMMQMVQSPCVVNKNESQC